MNEDLKANIDSLNECFERIQCMTSAEQAICVGEAAQVVLHIWQKHEKEQGLPSLGAGLLSRFEEWLHNKIGSSDLQRYAKQLYQVLPQDLSTTFGDAFREGLAGWAILGVATVAIKEHPEVQDSIIQTSVVYAAQAAVGSGKSRELYGDLQPLSDDERLFVRDWWKRCCTRFPSLAS